MKRKLTPKQRKFANEFIKTNNAYQSAISAGYSKAYAKNAGKFLLENIGIKNYIQQKTGSVEKRESDEADEVLKNIYRIASGRSISHDFVRIDNLKKEETTNETTIAPAPFKEQVNASELWFKLSGRLKNDSKDVEDQKIRKLKADADLAELKVEAITGDGDNQERVVIMDDFTEKEDETDGNSSD